MSIQRSLRFKILIRDNYTCQYCGAQAPHVQLEIDHIIPRSKGGRDRYDNLVVACHDCNRGKRVLELPTEQVARFSKPSPAQARTRRMRQEMPAKAAPIVRSYKRLPQAPCQTIYFQVPRTTEPATCDCGEEIEDGEELCPRCHDNLYVYCWTCGEEEQEADSGYCVQHRPHVAHRGGVAV